MKKRRHLILILLGFFLLVTPAFASQICSGDNCTSDEVGVFMQHISGSCGNTGDCSVDDIMTVFYNVGNYVLSIIGAIVLVLYVIGGLFLLTARGDKSKVSKGFKFISTSTVGLLIVLFAYAGVKTLESTLMGGGEIGGGEYAVCGPGDVNHGEACGDFQKCDHGLCLTQCEIDHPTFSTGVFSVGDIYSCVDKRETAYSSLTQCEDNKCPGDNNIKCCNITSILP